MRNECVEKVTKYELSILRRLAMAQEKPGGEAKSPPPRRIGLTLAGTGYALAISRPSSAQDGGGGDTAPARFAPN